MIWSKKAPRGFRPDIQGMRALAGRHGGAVPPVPAPAARRLRRRGRLLRHLRLPDHRAPAAASPRRPAGSPPPDFWGRRAKRLVPAAALVLTVTWVASRLSCGSTQLDDTARQIRASALYFQNWQLAGDAVDYLKSDNVAEPGAALLVAFRRGAVLPRLAAAVRVRGLLVAPDRTEARQGLPRPQDHPGAGGRGGGELVRLLGLRHWR